MSLLSAHSAVLLLVVQSAFLVTCGEQKECIQLCSPSDAERASDITFAMQVKLVNHDIAYMQNPDKAVNPDKADKVCLWPAISSSISP